MRFRQNSEVHQVKHLVLLIGPAGSGKTTYALEKVKEGYTRISQDDLGKVLHWTDFQIEVGLQNNIVLDRMNFSVLQRQKYVELARSNGYKITFVVFHVPYDICLERCLKRENHPTIKTEENARSALNTFFTKYEKPLAGEGDEVINLGWEAPYKPQAIICDLDGTLCDLEHRRHFVRDGQKNWPAFFSAMEDDKCNEWCKDIIERYQWGHNGHRIILCSGRPEDYRTPTESWLTKHEIPYDKLLMRPKKDSREDSIIKEIILDFEILPRYNVLFSIDDRDQVVSMWRKRGITCLQCDYGDF